MFPMITNTAAEPTDFKEPYAGNLSSPIWTALPVTRIFFLRGSFIKMTRIVSHLVSPRPSTHWPRVLIRSPSRVQECRAIVPLSTADAVAVPVLTLATSVATRFQRDTRAQAPETEILGAAIALVHLSAAFSEIRPLGRAQAPEIIGASIALVHLSADTVAMTVAVSQIVVAPVLVARPTVAKRNQGDGIFVRHRGSAEIVTSPLAWTQTPEIIAPVHLSLYTVIAVLLSSTIAVNKIQREPVVVRRRASVLMRPTWTVSLKVYGMVCPRPKAADLCLRPLITVQGALSVLLLLIEIWPPYRLQIVPLTLFKMQTLTASRVWPSEERVDRDIFIDFRHDDQQMAPLQTIVNQSGLFRFIHLVANIGGIDAYVQSLAASDVVDVAFAPIYGQGVWPTIDAIEVYAERLSTAFDVQEHEAWALPALFWDDMYVSAYTAALAGQGRIFLVFVRLYVGFGLTLARFDELYDQFGQETLEMFFRSGKKPSQVGHEVFHLEICKAFFFRLRFQAFPWDDQLKQVYMASSSTRQISKDYAGYYCMKAAAAARRRDGSDQILVSEPERLAHPSVGSESLPVDQGPLSMYGSGALEPSPASRAPSEPSQEVTNEVNAQQEPPLSVNPGPSWVRPAAPSPQWSRVARDLFVPPNEPAWESVPGNLNKIEEWFKMYDQPEPIVSPGNESLLKCWKCLVNLPCRPFRLRFPSLESFYLACGQDSDIIQQTACPDGILGHHKLVQFWLEYTRDPVEHCIKSVTMCVGPAVVGDDDNVPPHVSCNVMDCYLALKEAYHSGHDRSPRALSRVLRRSADWSRTSLLQRLSWAFNLRVQPRLSNFDAVLDEVGRQIQLAWSTNSLFRDQVSDMLTQLKLTFLHLVHGQSKQEKVNEAIDLMLRAFDLIIKAAREVLKDFELHRFVTTYGCAKTRTLLEGSLRCWGELVMVGHL
ncbi:hypothetical protein QBC40DRAFT_259723 [Triangularia verruculosa]|uniref:Uncharacterized protein n=1 Tax=Triangularia verruculosa TaxID=2587418 RepID=A0AAN7APV1_9PEZI|nr:hypothetical protein QBC40DRAFT_259723 [Triangularia verruculosa]